MKVFLINQLS